MPVYSYRCSIGHNFELFMAVSNHRSIIDCPYCDGKAQTVITAPLMVKASPDVCYDSPIDGKPITSMAAREEDLKRNNCRPYDPMRKDDYIRRQADSRKELDAAVDATVEESIAKMPTAKRAKLWSEVTEQGVGLDFQRSTKTN